MNTPTSDTSSQQAGPANFDDPNLNWIEPDSVDAGGNESTGQLAGAAASAAAAATPESAPATVEAPAGATSQPAAANTDGAQRTAAAQQPPVPYDRHVEILNNERAERERYAWARDLADAGISGEKVREALKLYDGVDGDPVKFVENFVGVLRQNPDLAGAVEAWLGRVAAGHGAAREARRSHGDDPEPQADYVDRATGNPIYSPERLAQWQAWHNRKVRAEAAEDFDRQLRERVAPLQQDYDERRAIADAREYYNSQVDAVKAEIERVKVLPYFKEHKEDIKALCAAKDYKISVLDAYLEVLQSKIVPNLTSRGADELAARLRQGQVASAVSPTATSTAPPQDPKGFHDPNLKW